MRFPAIFSSDFDCSFGNLADLPPHSGAKSEGPCPA